MTNQELYNSLFEYDNGRLIRKVTVAQNAKKGDILGIGKTSFKYYRVVINGKTNLLHRIIWVMHFGDIPKGMQIDHIYHDSLDNRIENLRLATNHENSKNKSKFKNNTSGYPNIYIQKNGRYLVQIKNLDQRCSQSFKILEEAIQYRNEKYIEFDFHPNNGL